KSIEIRIMQSVIQKILSKVKIALNALRITTLTKLFLKLNYDAWTTSFTFLRINKNKSAEDVEYEKWDKETIEAIKKESKIGYYALKLEDKIVFVSFMFFIFLPLSFRLFGEAAIIVHFLAAFGYGIGVANGAALKR